MDRGRANHLGVAFYSAGERTDWLRARTRGRSAVTFAYYEGSLVT